MALCIVLLFGAVSTSLYFFYTSSANQHLVWQLSLMGLVWLLAAISAAHFLHHLPVGELDFDSEHWYFGEKVGTVSVRFDGQSCLLLRFEDDLKAACWLWLEARHSTQNDPHHWHDLRRAVYSRARASN